jgi:5-methylcytosine-specific restriction endonuclease McrA
VFARDGFRCTYVAADGRRCSATVALQVDHIRPIARGGASTVDNLRILCAQHNRLEGERLMGHSGPPG